MIILHESLLQLIIVFKFVEFISELSSKTFKIIVLFYVYSNIDPLWTKFFFRRFSGHNLR